MFLWDYCKERSLGTVGKNTNAINIKTNIKDQARFT